MTINLHNKYNMSEATPKRTFHLARIRKENSSPPPASPNCIHHILNLNLTPTTYRQKSALDPDFKTFYNTTSRSWRISHLRGQQRRSKESAASDRQAIVGTPFTPRDITEKEAANAIMPLMDREHYSYLMKAISGIRKGRLLSEIRYSQTINPESPRLGKSWKEPNGTESLFQPAAVEHGEFTSPKIVNISAQIRSRKGGRSGEKHNSFQKVFKNKRKLHDKYFEGRQGAYFHTTILGEQELTIHQVDWAKRTLHHQKNN